MSTPEPSVHETDGAPHQFAEGEEAPPPGVRLMAWLRWLLVLAMAVLAALSVARHYGVWSTPSHAHAQLYTCPMHPSVVRDQPGSCPICDMSLVPVEAVKAQDSKTASSTAAVEGGAYYCPMHPEVTSDDPNATCPKCNGMKLVPRPRSHEVAHLTLDSERAQRMGIKTEPVVRGQGASELSVWGVVKESDGRVSRVHARSAGYVEQLFVKERAAQVKAGAPLLALFSPELVAAQRELLTTLRFRTPGTSPGAMPDMSDAAREKLRTLGLSEADISAIVAQGSEQHALTIRSPLGGFVSQKPVLQGSYVEAGALLMEITDLSEVWVLANVPESTLTKLELGATAHVHVSGEPVERTGELSFIYPEIDVAQRTAQVRIRLANKDLKLRPGMSAEVELGLPTSTGLFIPHSAVLDAGTQKYVFVQRENAHYVQLVVRLGARAGELVEVLEGLAEGDRVVTSAAFLLDSETRLRGTRGTASAASPGAER